MEKFNNQKRYTHRFLARIIIEATTPLSIGSGEKDIICDHLVARDSNGLPYIPGTAIAGIVRHSIEAIDKVKAEMFFGCNMTAEEKERQSKGKSGGKKGLKESTGEGSQIIFSSAHLVINKERNEVVEGLLLNPFEDTYLKNFEILPIRQHVRINEQGSAVKKAKFDEEVVFKGTRFCFEIEMLSENEKNGIFSDVLSLLASDTLCIGSGTRSGHGEFKVEQCLVAVLDLTDVDHRKAYIEKDAALKYSIKDDFSSGVVPFWKNTQYVIDITKNLQNENDGWTTYTLVLKPEDFFLFGSGFGNDIADMTPVTEVVVDWSDAPSAPAIKDNYILIPGSSVKGAISHRVAYHYNKLKKWYAGDKNAKPAEENDAVKALFGYAINDKLVKRGNVIISDFLKNALTNDKKKLLNHVAIDRFTGGAIDGALFSEEVVYDIDESYVLTMKVQITDQINNEMIIAFENALRNIATGMLPLGGGTNRGHGCFRGKVFKNSQELDLTLIETMEEQTNEQSN